MDFKKEAQIWKEYPDYSPVNSHTLGTHSLRQVGALVPAQQQPSASLTTWGGSRLRPGAGPVIGPTPGGGAPAPPWSPQASAGLNPGEKHWRRTPEPPER